MSVVDKLLLHGTGDNHALNVWQRHVLERLADVGPGGILEQNYRIGQDRRTVEILAPLVVDCRLAVVICEAPMHGFYVHRYLAARKFARVPSLVSKLGAHIVDGAPTLHVVPRTALSASDGHRLLPGLRPELVICQKMPTNTVRGARLSDYLTEQSPRVLVWNEDY